MRSQAALLKEAEPVAASSQAIVIKFKYEIHCQMAMENANFIDTVSTILYNLVGGICKFGVPEDQWLKIREGFLNNEIRMRLVNWGNRGRSNYRRGKKISW